MVRERPKKMTPFETWVQDEGLKVITAHTIKDIATEELAPWEKTGCDGALLDLTHDPDPNVFINNQGTIRYLVEIPPGGTFKAERHMYEEISTLRRAGAPRSSGTTARRSTPSNGKRTALSRSR